METAIEAIVAAAAVWPLARLSADRPFRALLPGPASALTVIVALWLAFILTLAVHRPLFLRPLAAGACAVAIVAMWRARPAFGRRRRLPPGSLAYLGSLRTLIDPWFYLDQARRYGPVFKTRQFHRPMACVVGLERATGLLHKYEDALVSPALPFNRHIPGGFLRYMAPAAHQTYRPVFQIAFASRVVRACEPFIAAATREGLKSMVDACNGSGKGVLPRVPLESLVLTIFLRVFFGVDPRSDEFQQLAALYPQIDPRLSFRRTKRQWNETLSRMEAIVADQAARLAAQGEAAAPSFLTELVRVRPEALRDRTVVVNLIYIPQTTRTDVSGLLPWLLKMLSDHPQWITRLRSESETAEGNLAERFVQETLRLEQSEFLYRRVRHDMEVDGCLIPRGWLLRICIRESHRDPAIFEDPDRFDPDRFLDRRISWLQYSPFGFARHACIGRDFTRAMGRVFLQELAAGFDWQVLEDGPRESGGRHWDHWRPNSRFRIDIAARS